MTGNRYNFGVGWSDWYFQDVDETNTVDGKPVYYWVNRHDSQIPLDAGYVAIVNSTDIRVEGLDLKNNYQGILIAYSNNVTICQNNITDNYNGIWLVASSNNTIYHNNFNNTNHVEFWPKSFENVWDDGYPSGGNYWSDYTGVDVKKGTGQDLPGSDGIGDTPYIIDADNVDHYPLMSPYGAPPPPTYALTITTTIGGTTDPAPGTYSYIVNSTVQVTAIPSANYVFDHWELDTVNVGSANPYTVPMDKDHTVKAVFTPIPPPLSASINPLSASINVGQSVTFASTASGGYPSYSYQWYLNGNPFSGATSNTWAFTPTTSGIYYVHLKVTDAKANTAQSETARITAATVPVGGYSIPIQVQTKTEPIIPYIAFIAALTAIFTKLKPKTKRKR
jgi:parallel beta-helix repeat protein